MNVAPTDARTIPEVRLEDLAATGIAPLEKAGCLVITGVTAAAERERLRGELGSHMDGAPVWEGDNPKAFFPGYTRRIASMVARSETARDWIMHPLARALCDHFLLPNCDDRYQLHVTAAIEIGPGARKQVLHREEDSFHFFPLPRPNLVLATMWSVTDFTAENGATLLVPGSHRWPRERRATPDEVVCAEMEAGSVLIWLGGTLHAGGANVSNDWRYGVILTYSVAKALPTIPETRLRSGVGDTHLRSGVGDTHLRRSEEIRLSRLGVGDTHLRPVVVGSRSRRHVALEVAASHNGDADGQEGGLKRAARARARPDGTRWRHDLAVPALVGPLGGALRRPGVSSVAA